MMKDGPRLLTGSLDASVKVWNISTGEPVLETSLPAAGPVQRIRVSDSTVMYSVDEPSLPPASGAQDLIPCGVIHLLNPSTGTTIPIKKTEDLPYTHPWSIRSFIIAPVAGELFAMSAGGEGSISMWKLDQATMRFSLVMSLEGHLRGVTDLVLQGKGQHILFTTMLPAL